MKLLSVSMILAMASCAKGPDPIVPETKVERQMIGLLQKFDRWDDDGNGYLTASELKPAEEASGHSPAKIIAFYDTDHDNRISLKEAQVGVSRADEAEQKAKH
jgi:hypothetical protein